MKKPSPLNLKPSRLAMACGSMLMILQLSACNDISIETPTNETSDTNEIAENDYAALEAQAAQDVPVAEAVVEPDWMVEVFAGCDYQGASAKLTLGDFNMGDLGNVGIGNDTIS